MNIPFYFNDRTYYSSRFTCLLSLFFVLALFGNTYLEFEGLGKITSLMRMNRNYKGNDQLVKQYKNIRRPLFKDGINMSPFI